MGGRRPGLDSSAPASADPVGEALDRHDQRRAHGVPTVSVVVGPVGLALQEARRWAAARGRPVVATSEVDVGPVVAAWVARLCAARDLAADALAWLARRDGRPAEGLAARIGRMTPFERASYLESRRSIGVETARGLVLGAAGGPGRVDAVEFLRRFEAERSGGPEDWPEVVAALRGLVPPGADPALVVTPPAADGLVSPAWGLAAGRLLERLSGAEPGLALMLAVPAAGLEAMTRQGPGTRASTLLEQAVVTVPTLDADAIRREVGAGPGPPRDLDASARRLAEDGATPGLVALFHAAADAADDDDRARSAAERFLFERLASLPATAGRFRLNGKVDLGPDARVGTREVDLLAEELALALEIDGYHHFRDADAYRRDRRKDLDLQRAGYLVVRVLAADVVERLEEVLETILSAVGSQRARAPT